MAGLRLVPRSLTATMFGLCAVIVGLVAGPVRAQDPASPSMFPEYPPTYENSGNVIRRGVRDGEISVDLGNRRTVDPLAGREPARNRDYRAAERSATYQPQARPLSEAFDPALRPTNEPLLATPSAAPQLAPGATRTPASDPARGRYPALVPSPPSANQPGSPPAVAGSGPLGVPASSAGVGPSNMPFQGGTTTQTASNPSPLGPPEPPKSSNPDLIGAGVPTGPLVMDVRVEGNETIQPERIRPHVKCRKGRPLDTQQVEEDVKRLLATRLFTAVRPKYLPVAGGVTVLFQVVERPTLKYVKYTGSKVRNKTLAKQTGLKKGDAADPFAVEEARIKLEQFFRERGHNKVRVTVTEGTEPGDQGAVFVIHEGPIPRVNKVTFINNTIASDARLKTQVKSKPPWFRVPGVFPGWKGFAQPDTINADVDILTDYYRGLGFFSARISREVELDENQKWANLTFVIDEGPRYSLRTVSFIGQKRFTEEELKEKLSLKPGEFFDRTKMRGDVAKIEEKYGAKGYVFADIEAAPRFFEEPGQLDLVFRVSEGARCRVGNIEVRINGENPHTRRLAVLNRLSFRSGDIMDIRKVRDSERRLQASGIFLYKPQEGQEPKITFSPPDGAGTDNLVENPDDPHRGVRGQSPDPTSQSFHARRPVAERDPELVVNLVFDGCDVPHEVAPGGGQRMEDAGVIVLPRVATMAGSQRGMPLPDESLSMLETRWDPRPTGLRSIPDGVARETVLPPASTRRPAPSAQRARSALPPGTIIRGQSPDVHGYSAGRSDQPLAWRPPQPAGRAAAAIHPENSVQPRQSVPASAVRRPAIVRGQGDTGYQPMSGEVMPSFSIGRQGTQPPAPSWDGATRPTYPSTTYPPPGRQVISPNGLPVGSSYYQPPAGGGVAVPTSPPVSAQPQPATGAPTSPNTYGQYVPAAQTAPPVSAPNWMSPNVPPSQPNGSPQIVQPPAAGGPAMGGQPPGILPPPEGYESPADAFGPGERNWLDEEPIQDVPVIVTVDETQTGRLMLGVGVNSNAGLVGSAVIDEQNFDWTRIPRNWNDVISGTAFRGAGQHFRLEAMPGTQFQRYLVSFTEPYLFDTPVLFGVNGSYFVRAYPNWTEQRLGGRVNLGYQLAPDLTVGGALRAESINISNPSVPTPQQLLDVLGNNSLYTARVNIVQDTRDSAFLPTQGRRLSAAFEQGFGDFSYPRGEFEATQYFLLRQRPDGSGRHTLRLGGQFGISGSDTPIFENFFAGGYSSIRGFRFRGASPVDMGVIVGGRLMLLAGAEYMFPITADDMLRGVIFCDTGTVEQDLTIDGDDYRVAVGAGFRITVPLMGPAPIALDFAVPLARADTDQSQVLSFFVGVQY